MHETYLVLKNHEQAIYQCKGCGYTVRNFPDRAEALATIHERTGV